MTGRAAWLELLTIDPDTAGRFYAELFGWQRKGDALVDANGAAFGRLVVRPRAEGRPARWAPFLPVARLEAGIATLEGAGGRVVARGVLPARGALAAGAAAVRFRDFDRAPVGLAEGPATQDSPAVWLRYVGFDRVQVERFYGALTEGIASDIWRPGVRMPSYWLPVFEVPDVDAALGRALALGGHPVQAPTVDSRLGSFAAAADSLGAPFGLRQPSEKA